jgi:hypothetical protein
VLNATSGLLHEDPYNGFEPPVAWDEQGHREKEIEGGGEDGDLHLVRPVCRAIGKAFWTTAIVDAGVARLILMMLRIMRNHGALNTERPARLRKKATGIKEKYHEPAACSVANNCSSFSSLRMYHSPVSPSPHILPTSHTIRVAAMQSRSHPLSMSLSHAQRLAGYLQGICSRDHRTYTEPRIGKREERGGGGGGGGGWGGGGGGGRG